MLDVQVKKHVKNGKSLSMGFGFIELDSVDTAINVCRDLQVILYPICISEHLSSDCLCFSFLVFSHFMQGTVLDGHALILQLCHAKKDDQAAKKTELDQSSTKLIVRNVAFEATEKELRQLFSPFGQVTCDIFCIFSEMTFK